MRSHKNTYKYKHKITQNHTHTYKHPPTAKYKYKYKYKYWQIWQRWYYVWPQWLLLSQWPPAHPPKLRTACIVRLCCSKLCSDLTVVLKIVLWPHFRAQNCALTSLQFGNCVEFCARLCFELWHHIDFEIIHFVQCISLCTFCTKVNVPADVYNCIYLGTLTFVAYTVEVNRGLVCKGTKAVRTRSGFGLAAPSGPRRINAFLTLSNFTSNSPQIVNFYQWFNLNCQLLLSINPKFSTFTNDST